MDHQRPAGDDHGLGPAPDPPVGPGGLDLAGAVAAVGAGTVTAGRLDDDARARARDVAHLGAVVGWADADRPARPDGPLAGAVVGVKDMIAVRGRAAGWGNAAFAAQPPAERDAPVVARLRDAGAGVGPLTELHELAFGLTTPQTSNPLAPDRVAGGSSGGSAAAVAAGVCHAALGTDTGGSIRVPAACCGVAGLKPTNGLVPLTGVQPLGRWLDCVGPIAARAADLPAVLGVIAGPDGRDPYALSAAAGPVGAAGAHDGDGRRGPPLAGLRVGLPAPLGDLPLQPVARAGWRRALDRLEAAGAEVRRVDLAELADGQAAASVALLAEAASVHRERFAHAAELLGDDTRRRLEHGMALPGWQVAEARHHGRRLAARATRVLDEQVDLLCTPALPCAVPAAGSATVDLEGVRAGVVAALTMLTNPWNLAGLPAGCVPVGSDAGGAPVAAQLIGPPRSERLVVRGLQALELPA